MLVTTGIIIGVVVASGDSDGEKSGGDSGGGGGGGGDIDITDYTLDDYATMNFTLDAKVDINSNYFIGQDDSYIKIPINTTCDELMTNITEDYTQTPWNFFQVLDSQMNSTAMNSLLYCMAKAPEISEDNWGYYFINWSGLEGLLSTDVLDYLVTRAPKATQYYLDKATELSADE